MLDNILISSQISDLYKDIQDINSEVPIKGFTKNNLGMLPGQGGYCILKKEQNIRYVEITINEDFVDEDTISHELFHAKQLFLGYGQKNILEPNAQISKVCECLANSLLHVNIYAEQDKYAFERKINLPNIIHGFETEDFDFSELLCLVIQAIDSKQYGYKDIEKDTQILFKKYPTA